MIPASDVDLRQLQHQLPKGDVHPPSPALTEQRLPATSADISDPFSLLTNTQTKPHFVRG